MAWEKFKANRKRLDSSLPTLTMSKSQQRNGGKMRQFRFNVKTVDKFALGRFNYAQLYFDPDIQAIGVEPLKTYQLGAARFTREKGSRGIIFTGGKFARRFGIDFEGNREVRREGKLLVVRL